MSDPITRLRAGDFEEAMDFLNLVFSVHGPHDFARLLPLLYRPDDEHMRCNFAIRDQGRLRAMVGLFPLTWRMGERDLRVAGIGGVATHPGSQGQGLMGHLMQHVQDELQRQPFQLSYLSGRRRRYGHFGFERAGCFQYCVVSRDILPSTKADKIEEIALERIADPAHPALKEAHKLHETLEIRVLRDFADFRDRCHSWKRELWIGRDQQGKMLGYLVAGDKDPAVAELVGTSTDNEIKLLKAWVLRGSSDFLNVDVAPSQTALARRLGAVCEHFRVESWGNWRFLDWPEVLSALLQAKCATTPLQKGEVVLEVEGRGRLALRVANGQGVCEPTSQAPVLKVNEPTALRLLGGPFPPSRTLDLPPAAALLENWCPLPLTWPRQDGV